MHERMKALCRKPVPKTSNRGVPKVLIDNDVSNGVANALLGNGQSVVVKGKRPAQVEHLLKSAFVVVDE